MDNKNYRLKSTIPPVNVFALVGANHPKFPANKEDNEALAKAGADYAERFMVARNMPANDEHWDAVCGRWLHYLHCRAPRALVQVALSQLIS